MEIKHLEMWKIDIDTHTWTLKMDSPDRNKPQTIEYQHVDISTAHGQPSWEMNIGNGTNIRTKRHGQLEMGKEHWKFDIHGHWKWDMDIDN